MAVGTSGRAARILAIAGAVSIVVAIVVSITTDENADWAWGAMILTTLIGLVLFAIAAVMVLKRRHRGGRAVLR